MITTWYWILGVLVCFRETFATQVPVSMLSNPLCLGLECQHQLLYQPVHRTVRSHYQHSNLQLSPPSQTQTKCPSIQNNDFQNYQHLNEQQAQGLHTQVYYQAQKDVQNYQKSTYQNNGYLPPHEDQKKTVQYYHYDLDQHHGKAQSYDLTQYHQDLSQNHGKIANNYGLTQGLNQYHGQIAQDLTQYHHDITQHHGKIAHTIKYDVDHHYYPSHSHHIQSGGKSSTNIEQHHDLHDNHEDHHDHHDHDEHSHHKKKNAYYKFDYSVNDQHTGDIKNHKEERKGDEVRGEYSLVEKDGNVRTVKYFADWKTGFHATVHNSKSRS